MYLACYTQEEIADQFGVTKETISQDLISCQEMESLPKSDKILSEFQDNEFDLPIYNIWNFAKKTNDVSHFGNTEVRIVENLKR